jgi:hypothetical protein
MPGEGLHEVLLADIDGAGVALLLILWRKHVRFDLFELHPQPVDLGEWR